MTNRERSVFEHNGIPLKISQNSGRVRREEAPWLETFSAMQAAHVVEKSFRRGMAEMPELAAGEEDDLPELQAAGSDRPPGREAADDDGRAQPGTPQGESFAASRSFTHPSDVGTPQTPSAVGPRHEKVNDEPQARKHEANAPAARGPAGEGRGMMSISGRLPEQHAAPVMPPVPEASQGAQRQSAAQGVALVSSAGAAGAGRHAQPRVLVQKFIKITPPAAAVGQAQQSPGAGGSQPTASQVVEVPMAYFAPQVAAVFATSPGGKAAGEGSPLADASADAEAQSREQTARTEFLNTAFLNAAIGAAGVAAADPRWAASAEIRPRAAESQPAVLERLNQQSAREHAVAPKRVHIGNLHITVQRPGAPGAPAQAQTAQPSQREMPPQTFINPWDRYYTLFD